jgi:hypothetical protein
MNAKFSPLIFSLLMVCGVLTCSTARAQDEGYSANESQDSNHPELNTNEDRTIISEHELKLKSTTHDSAQMHAKPASTTIATAKSRSSDHNKPSNGKEEEDALSFNFLYYIIQKFKISDLIDN